MKRSLSFLLAVIVVFCTLSSVTATVYADYDANLVAHQKMDNILQNYVDPNYHLDDFDNFNFTVSEEYELQAVAFEAIKGCTTEYEKITAITKLVAENIYYDRDFVEKNTTGYTKPYDVWINKRTICGGYADLIKALLNLINIPCVYIHSMGTMNHAYNAAYDFENDRWIYLDATGCSGNKYTNGEYVTGSYSSYYFDIPLETLADLPFHKIRWLTGIAFDGVYYTIETPNDIDIWYDINEWYAFTEGVSDSLNKKVVNIVSFIDDVSVTSVGYLTFDGCSSLKSITIPSGITSIGNNAFLNCTNLSSVTLPDTLISIGWYAFYGCTSLTSVTIPNGVTSIGSYAFYNCTGLETVTVGNGVTSIGSYAFYNCTGLETVTVGNGVTIIGDCAFSGCTSLKSIKFPDSVTSIGKSAFSGCSNLTSVYITDIASWCGISFGDSYSNPLRFANELYVNSKLVTDVVIPDGVTKIPDYTFCNNSNLISVTIPDSVTNIGDEAFSYCSNLTSITIGDSVTSIGKQAFLFCFKLTDITIPVSVKDIGSSAFYGAGIKNVFYTGNSSQWDKLDAGGDRCALNRNAKIHYNATGHTSSAWITDEKATANNEGKKHKECTQCGEILKPATIPQLKCSKPVLKKVYNANDYVKVTWGAVEGADLYRVYRKTGTGDYEYIGSTTNTYFNDKEAGAGKTCRYRIRAKNEAGYSEYSVSIAIKHIDEPALESIENSAYGVLIKWGKVTGAEKYNVYRKVSGGEYKYIGATSNTYYTDKTAKSGTKYYYAIRAKKDDSISSQSASLSKYYLADPTLKTPSSTTSGIKLSWSKVTGAEGYMVYRKTGSGSYSKIATVEGSTKVTYRDSSAQKGKKYTYKVKAYKSKTYSAYSNTKSVTDKY